MSPPNTFASGNRRSRRSCTHGFAAVSALCPSRSRRGALAIFTSQGEDASVQRTWVRTEVEPYG